MFSHVRPHWQTMTSDYTNHHNRQFTICMHRKQYQSIRINDVYCVLLTGKHVTVIRKLLPPHRNLNFTASLQNLIKHRDLIKLYFQQKKSCVDSKCQY